MRHGETEKNVDNLTHKHGEDTELNSKGRDQAAQLAAVCKRHNIHKIFCSPEARAVQTAHIIGSELDIRPIVLEGLTERDWGDWEGQPWSEIEAQLSQLSLDERRRFVPPHGESWEQMENRLLSSIDVILQENDSVAVVTHAGALRALMPPLKREPLENSFSYEFDNASVTIFRQKNGMLTQTLENDTSHLIV